MAFTIHYVTAPNDAPNDWHLCTENLAFHQLEGSHSGANQAELLVEIVDKHGFKDNVCSLLFLVLLRLKCEQFGWLTADNASVNDRAVKVFGRHIDPTGKKWVAKEHRIGHVDLRYSLSCFIYSYLDV